MTKNNIYLASKPRYEILDGLRGVAAMLVVAYLLLDSTGLHDLLQFLAHRPVVHPPEHQFVFLYKPEDLTTASTDIKALQYARENTVVRNWTYYSTERPY